MSLNTKLLEDMRQAMRDHDSIKLGVIRFLRAEIKNIEIDHGTQDNESILKIIAKQAKSMRDANTEYLRGGRQDLVDENEKKIEILVKYLPEQLSDDELREIIRATINTSEEKHPGKIIGAVMKKIQGRADGSRVSQIAKTMLP